MKNYMIDLETMSTEPDAAILSIGVVEMDLDCFEFKREFYQNVTLSSCVALGLHSSIATRDWWAAQQPEARDALTKDAIDIKEALTSLRSYLCGVPDSSFHFYRNQVMPWSNGAGFDIVILESAYRALGLTAPWQFYNAMCYRTIKNLYPDVQKPERIGIKHHALDDAKTQASHLFAIAQRHPGVLRHHRKLSMFERLITWGN